MLSANTLLRDGRYRIGHAVTSGRAGTIYLAEDQISKQQVVIVEQFAETGEADGGRIDNLMKEGHAGLMRVTEHFEADGHDYFVTEPVAKTEANSLATDRTFECLRAILKAIDILRSERSSIKAMEIRAENVIATEDGSLKLLYVDTPGILSANNLQESPYLPFESVWSDLDLISQRAFYREFDDRMLESLDSPPDARCDMYSLGAVFYKLFTGRLPISAFERSFEMLGGKNDPLAAISSLNNSLSEEQSQFLMRLLALKREDRFDSLEEAILKMPMTSNDANKLAHNDLVDLDDLDLLEIPTEPQRDRVEVVANGNGSTAHAIDQVVAFSKTEISPESAMHAEDLNSFVDQFYSSDELHDRIDAHLAARKAPEEPVAEVAESTTSAEPAEDAKVVEPVIEPVVEKRPSATVFSLEPDPPAASGGLGKMIGIAVAGIVVVGVAGFGLLSMTSSDSSQAQEQPLYQAPAASLSSPPQQQPEPSAEPVNTVSTELQQPVDAQPDTKGAPVKGRPQTAELKPTKPETKPAKPEEKPKKKMTVDDLLN